MPELTGGAGGLGWVAVKAVLLFAVAVIGPAVTPPEPGEPVTYPARLFQFLSFVKIWIIVSVLVGLGTAWQVRRREVDVFQSSSWFWPILAGACGWFGWIGYSFVNPLPARLPNHQWLPAQPEPARPLGTEIFA